MSFKRQVVIMIDRRNRDHMAQAIRSLASGLVTNDAFDDERVPRPFGEDLAIREIYWSGVWPLYGDMQCYRLRGKDALSDEQRRWLARCVMFLKTDLPYEWPTLSRRDAVALFFKNLVSLGKARKDYLDALSAAGDREVWPFLRMADFAAAKREPRYCVGNATPGPLRGSA